MTRSSSTSCSRTGGGVEVLRMIRQASRVPVIMLTAKGDQVDRVLGAGDGGRTTISPSPATRVNWWPGSERYLRRIDESVARPGGDELRLGRLRLLPPQRRVEWDGKPIELTPSEFNCLETLLRGGDRVVTKDEISEKVLGRTREPYDRSVDVHMSHLRRKLAGIAGDGVTIETVRGIGYRVRQ